MYCGKVCHGCFGRGWVEVNDYDGRGWVVTNFSVTWSYPYQYTPIVYIPTVFVWYKQ